MIIADSEESSIRSDRIDIFKGDPGIHHPDLFFFRENTGDESCPFYIGISVVVDDLNKVSALQIVELPVDELHLPSPNGKHIIRTYVRFSNRYFEKVMVKSDHVRTVLFR